ncbi:iron ABC transporter permease [Gracilibacillus dipsosauri]|uniref:Iron ABC transporter permease n=2 Tax=Gracilibacillus dipsosauri TaxID=178340 RepID=A0A317L101_9BACI|nr:iron ABC transporter permease [Gracilibacillus dipsosauri]
MQISTKENRGIMPKRALSSLFTWQKILMGLALVMIAIIFLLPIYRLIALSIQVDGSFSLANYTTILQDSKTWSVMGDTILIVLGSTTISVTLGIVFAWLVAYTDIRGKRLMQLFIILPFVIPSYITTLAWTQFFGANGLYEKLAELFPFSLGSVNLYSMGGIIFVLGFSHYPLVYLLSISVFRKIPREVEHASRVSGASSWQTFRRVTLPLALPGIASGGFLAFLANLDNFGIPAFLGIPAKIDVLSTYIYQQVVGFGPTAFERASTLSVLLGVIALMGTFLQWLLLRKSKRIETTVEDEKARFFLRKSKVIVEIILWSFLLLTSLVPLLAMGMTSLLPAYGVDFTWDHISLKNYQFVLETSPKAKRAIGNSVQLAVVITIIGVMIGTMFAYFRVRKPNRWNQLSEIVISLPYALPGTVMALSMIFAWMEPIPGWNPGIYGSVLILFIAYFTRFLILQVRGSITAVLQVDYTMEEAAIVSGSNSWVKWRKILLPLLLPSILSGAFLVFLTALTELTVSSLLWSSNSETIGVVIFGFEQAGYTTYSTAFSSLIIIFILLGFFLLYITQFLWNRKVARTR